MSKARDYYVSLRRGSGDKAKFSLLAGPFSTREEAEKFVLPAKQEASRLDTWTDFDSIGTCSIRHLPENRKGFLNVYLGIPSEAA